MRLPPSVRYFPSRLQGVLNPWLWLGILVVGIVGVYAWEYRQNPGQLPWQIGTTGRGVTGDATSTDVLLESLTPEEQAVAAELDNIELLLAQLDSDVSALTSGGDTSAAAALNAALANAAGETSESSVERLTRYIDEYDFLGTGARGANIGSEQDEIPVQQRAESILTLQPEPADESENSLQTSVLAEALARQQSASESAEISVDARGLPVSGAAEPADDGSTDDGSSFSFDQTGVVPGSLDGLNRTFIRTTPSMSPPPGTTGYTPPASLPTFNQLNRSAGVAPVPTQFGTFDRSSPSVPDRSQTLPPSAVDTTPQLETPTLGEGLQTTPSQPRNAWESFWD